MSSTKTGSCLCKAVQYELTGTPDQMFVCHCDSCQKSTGSAFMANCIFKKDQLEITRGQESLKTYNDNTSQSGETLKRSFCSICGSRLFVSSDKLENAQFIAVGSGTIDQRADLHPTMEVWERDRRPWLLPIKGIPRMHTQ